MNFAQSQSVRRNEVRQCNREGKRASQAGPGPAIEKVASGSAFGNLEMSFRGVSFEFWENMERARKLVVQ